MKAVIYRDKDKIELADVPDPKISTPTDAIVNIETASVCGLDIQALQGTLGQMESERILGHEGVGLVHEVGPDVRDLKPGDRVVVCSTVACGYCPSCKAGRYSLCDTVEHERGGHGCTFFGSPGPYGGLDGLQAESARIPHANVTLVKLPDRITNDQAIFLSDLFPSGYFAAESASVQPNDNVAVFGCGPVGQFAIAAAKHMGAARVIAVDSLEYNLDMARAQGAESVDLESEDPVETIRRLTGGNGADRVLDTVGVDVHRWHTLLSGKDGATQPASDHAGSRASAATVLAAGKGATISIVGVNPNELRALPLGEAIRKNITIHTGHCNHRNYVPHLIELIEAGTVDPLQVYAHRIPYTGIQDAYEAVRTRHTGWMKLDRFLTFSTPR